MSVTHTESEIMTVPDQRAHCLVLDRKKELCEALEMDDDWTGVTDPVERRRRQNRLHQRAWRKRKAAAKQKDQDQTGVPREESAAGYPLPADAADFFVAPTVPMPNPPAFSDFNPSSIAEFMPLPAACNPSSSRVPAQVAPIAWYNAPFPRSYPAPPDSVPVGDSNATDRSWIPLAQYNNLRTYMPDVVVSAFLIPLNINRTSLRPTPLQQRVPHKGWIDSVPFPRLRDNLIMYQDVYDTAEFYSDMVNGGSQGYQDDECAVLCDPWGEEGWELSEGFVRKWSPLLEGCEILVRTTRVE